jgi:hypothetical protein
MNELKFASKQEALQYLADFSGQRVIVADQFYEKTDTKDLEAQEAIVLGPLDGMGLKVKEVHRSKKNKKDLKIVVETSAIGVSTLGELLQLKTFLGFLPPKSAHQFELFFSF